MVRPEDVTLGAPDTPPAAGQLAWPGKVVVIACEPAVVEEMGFCLSDEVRGALDGAVELVLSTIEELSHDAAYQLE